MKKIIESTLVFGCFISSCFAVESKLTLEQKAKTVNHQKLSTAVSTHNQPFLNKFINSANINSHDADNNTLLHQAAKLGNEQTVSLLLNKKANPNATNNKNKTPLHMAAKTGNSKIVAALIASKAKVNAKTAKDKTALHYAAAKGSKDITAILISQGADTTIFDKFARTPMHTAIENNHLEIIKLLDAYAQALAKNPTTTRSIDN